MDWTKIPTTLITKRFSDYEISSIVKFQLVWAINEEQPDKKTCLRYMTSKQYETAMTYIDSISATVSGDVSYVINKRNAEKKRYSKNKSVSKILPTDCQQTGDSLPEQIREDNTKERESKEKDEGYNDLDNTNTPLLSASASNQPTPLPKDCSTYADEKPSKKESYKWEGAVIKLNDKDFANWLSKYNKINLRRELESRDDWLATQPDRIQKNWYMSTVKWFDKLNNEAV